MPAWFHRLLFGSCLALAVGCGSADPGVQGGAEAPEAGAARPKSRRSARPEIDPTQIVFSLRHREEEFGACAGEPRASGHVQLRWRVTKSGAVKDVKVLSSTLPDQGADRLRPGQGEGAQVHAQQRVHYSPLDVRLRPRARRAR